MGTLQTGSAKSSAILQQPVSKYLVISSYFHLQENSDWFLLNYCLLSFELPSSFCLTSPQQAPEFKWVVAA